MLLFTSSLLLKFLHRSQRAQECCGSCEPEGRSSTREVPSAAPPWPCCGFAFRGCPCAGCWQGFSSLGEEQEEPFLGTRPAAHPCPAVCAVEPLPCPAVSDVPGQGWVPGALRRAHAACCGALCQLPLRLPRVLPLQGTLVLRCGAEPE